MTDTPEWFSTKQVAHALGITQQTLRNWRKEGLAHAKYRMPGARGEFIWEADEVRRLLELGNNSRRVYRARKRKYDKYPHNGLVIVKPIPRRGRGTGL